MGYSYTKKSIDQVEPYLKMLQLGLDELFIDTSNPKRLAYLIMQGMAAADKLNDERFPGIYDSYKIAEEEKRIKCIKNVPIVSAPYLEFAEVKDMMDLLNAWLLNRDRGIDMRFPNLILNDEVKEFLSNKKHEVKDEYIMINGVQSV
jgi:hypothetical protein